MEEDTSGVGCESMAYSCGPPKHGLWEEEDPPRDPQREQQNEQTKEGITEA